MIFEEGNDWDDAFRMNEKLQLVVGLELNFLTVFGKHPIYKEVTPLLYYRSQTIVFMTVQNKPRRSILRK